MEERYEFGSDEWVAFAKRYVEGALAERDLTGVDVEFCEEYTDPPDHLACGERSIGWHLIVRDGEVSVDRGVIDARTKIVADYATIKEVARQVIDPDDGEQGRRIARLLREAIAAGKFTPPSGADDLSGVPELGGLHNALAVRTR